MGINKVVGLWTWCLALPSEHSWAAAQGSAPVPCFESLGYLKAYMGLGHHSALLEIETFWVDGSILLSLFMENRLFHDGNLPEILLLYFGSPACKAVWEQKKNLGQELELSREAKIFCSCWVFMFITLVSYPFPPNTRSMHVIWLVGLKDYRKWKHLFYPRPMLEKLTDQPALQLPASLSSPSNSLQFSIQFRVGNFKTKILYSQETLPPDHHWA